MEYLNAYYILCDCNITSILLIVFLVYFLCERRERNIIASCIIVHCDQMQLDGLMGNMIYYTSSCYFIRSLDIDNLQSSKWNIKIAILSEFVYGQKTLYALLKPIQWYEYKFAGLRQLYYYY